MRRRRRGAATAAEGEEGQQRNDSGKWYEPLSFLIPRYLFISLHRLISASSASLAVFRGDWDGRIRQTWPIFPGKNNYGVFVPFFNHVTHCILSLI